MISENINNFVLQNLSLNYSIGDIIDENPNLKNLFFTATGLDGKSPFGWFRRIFENNLIIDNIFEVEGRIWSFNCIINNRRFNVFMLPTPKPRGIHFTNNQRTITFCNYLQSIDIDFYNEIDNLPMINRTNIQKQLLSEYRVSFLIETYRQAIIENNLNFNGTL